MNIFQKKQIKNVLLVGSGGREHAMAQAFARSHSLGQLFILPGNPGTAELGQNIDLSTADHESIVNFIIDSDIDITVCGPEQPLADGLMDILRSDARIGQRIYIGPGAEGARLESSKSFAKAFMQRHGIPTAPYQSFTEAEMEQGLDFISSLQPPIVLKADGLAAGKGVLICPDHPQAENEFIAMLHGKYGKASKRVVIEQFIQGKEFSVFVLTNGTQYVLLPQAKDYKRIGEGDTGLNTGGMGAVSPVPFVTDRVMEKVISRIVEPTVQGLRKEQIDYRGFIFFGLILADGEPYVIEYNCRMGDPETEVVFPRINSDIIELIVAAHENRLDQFSLDVSPQAAACLMLVSGGYPVNHKTGFAIGMPRPAHGTFLFHAGTAIRDGQLVTNGGRVMAVTSFGENIRQAIDKSLHFAELVEFEGKYFRRDIGFDL